MLSRVELDADDAADWLQANGWSDGLPVVAPTPERVAEMVAECGRAPDEALGPMPPRFTPVTVEKVAVCAVLAGCQPAAMRVVLAGVEAVLAPPFRAASVQSTTSPAAPLLVVDGPAAEAAGVTAGTGCFAGAGANAVVGRAVRLVMVLVGGGRPGDGDPAPLGMPAKIAACFAERTDASPWPSLAERRGIAASASAVSAFAITGSWQISEPSTAVDDVVHQVLHGMINSGHNSQPRLPQSGEQLLVLTPPIARLIASRFPDVSMLQRALFDTVRVPLDWVPPYKRDATLRRLEDLGLVEAGGSIPVAESPDSFVVLVAGGDAGVQSMGMSTLTLSRSATALVC
jgi:hypothetical protein